MLGQHHAGRDALASSHHMQMLRPQAGTHCRSGRIAGQQCPQGLVRRWRITACRAVNQVDFWRTQKRGHKGIGWLVVQRHWRAQLLHMAFVEHGNAVAHGHGLHLVMGDVNHGGAQLFVQPAQLNAHVHPQRGVQVGQWFVKQKHLGLAHNGPAYGHPLALAARQLFGVTAQQLGDAQDLCGAFDLLVTLRCAHP